MNKYHILYTFDNNYFKHFMVSLTSLLCNNKNKTICVHIIADDLSLDNIKKLEELYPIYPNFNYKLYNSKKILDYIKDYNIPTYRNSLTPVYRLFYFLVLRDVEKFIYLDSDTIIRNSLELEQLSTDKVVMACIDHMPLEYIQKLNAGISTYFNSGVLLINNKEFMDKGMDEKIVKAIVENKLDLQFFDQDILNIALNGCIDTLPLKYNVLALDYYFKYLHMAFRYEFGYQDFYSDKQIKEALKEAIILHATDIYGIRPWDNNSIHPYNKIYREYYELIYGETLPADIDIMQIIKSKHGKIQMLAKYLRNRS